MKKISLQILVVLPIACFIIVCSLVGCQQKTALQKGPREKVTIAFTTNTNSALVQVALRKGYFADEGLDLTAQPYVFGKAAIEAMTAGKADLATMAETPFMFAVMRGEKIFAIATIETATKNEAIVARKDKGITKLQDLKGKKIGVSLGSGGELFMDSVFSLSGLKRQTVQVVDMKPESMVSTLVKGEVDAVATWNPNVVLLQKELGDRGVTFYGETAYTETFCLAGAQDFVNKNPGAIQKVLRALVRAARYVRQEEVESRQIVAGETHMDEALLAEIWPIFDYSVRLDQALLVALEDASRWAIRSGLVKQDKVPNYLDYIYLKGLAAVKPEAVSIIGYKR